MTEDEALERLEKLKALNDASLKKRMEEPSEWPPPDSTIRKWEAHGLLCAMSRGSFALCGYVCLPKSHPLAGKDCSELSPFVSVHGGLTYSTQGQEGYWYGFDTGHAGDLMFFTDDLFVPGRIWTVEDVEEETERLAEQISRI
jgi:hypothetical protein